MDEADLAQAHMEEEARVAALVRAQGQAQLAQVSECQDCDEPMHPVRKSYGFRRCVECQTLVEQQAAQQRKI